MATYYAWSNFPVERNEYGQVTKTIKAGDKVSQSDLDISDEDWQELINLGAVKEEEYPDVGTMESPAEYYAANPEETPEAKAAQQEGESAPAPSQTKVQQPGAATQAATKPPSA